MTLPEAPEFTLSSSEWTVMGGENPCDRNTPSRQRVKEACGLDVCGFLQTNTALRTAYTDNKPPYREVEQFVAIAPFKDNACALVASQTLHSAVQSGQPTRQWMTVKVYRIQSNRPKLMGSLKIQSYEEPLPIVEHACLFLQSRSKWFRQICKE